MITEWWKALGQSLCRGALRAWGRLGRAHGYWYQIVENWGKDLAPRGTLPARLPNGLTLNCDLRDHVQRHIYFQGVYEVIEAFLFTKLLQPGMTVVDGGANVGQYSLLASSGVGPGGTVHAFEPVPRNFDRLCIHLQINGVTNVRANRAGLWDAATSLQLGLAADMTENDGSFSVGAVSGSAVPVVTAPAVRFDDYAAEQLLDRIDLIKLDIEGAELAALRGMLRVLEMHRPVLLMEVNRLACTRLGYDASDLWDLLVKRFGYRVWKIGISAAQWELLPDPSGIVQANCLFTPGDLPAALDHGWDFRTCVRWGGSSGRSRQSFVTARGGTPDGGVRAWPVR